MNTTLRPFLTSIGPYRVLRPLGRGGAAAVYEVESPAGDHFALKLLTHPMSSARFEREYHTLARLSHPNIVRVYDYGFTDDRFPYLTMELLDGVPAQAHAKGCGRPGNSTRTAEVVRLGMLVADALEYLHGHRVIHRDLKSSNVLVLADGRVKLLDLGTARLLGGGEGITRQGEFVGTFTYASPEQLSGRPVDARSDLYSLGVLLYRLLTGRRPFEVDDPQELARMHLETTPQAPIQLAPTLAPTLSAYVMQLLAKRPDDRPPTARAVSETLRASGLAAAPLALGAPWRVTLPLLGRQREQAALEGMLDQPQPGAMLVLTGPAGLGARRLLLEAAAWAETRGAIPAKASFPGPTGLGALAIIAADLGRALRQDGTTDPSYSILRDASPSPPAATRVVLFSELFSLLKRRVGADGRPVLLLLDHLHRARPLALQALRAVRRRAVESGVPVMIVATVETGPDGALPEAVVRMFPDADMLALLPLEAENSGRLVSAMLGTETPSAALAARIHAASEGVPGNISALVRAAVRAGGRTRGRLALPGSVDQALTLHVQSLSRLCVRTVEALAAAGGEAHPELLTHVSELPPLELRAALLVLAREGLLQRLDDAGVETWRFRLPRLTQQIRASLDPPRLEALRGRVEAGLATAPPTATKIRLLVGAGQLAPAIAEAVPWAERWLDEDQPAEVLPMLAILVDGLDLCDAAPPPPLVSRLLLCHARALSAIDPRDARCDRSLARAMTTAPDDARRAEVDLATADLYRRRGQTDRARARVVRALRLLEQAPAPRLVALGRLHAGQDAEDRGDLLTAAASYEESRKGSERAGDFRTSARARLGLARLRLSRGELEEATRDGNRASAALARNQDDVGQWQAAEVLAGVSRLEGRFSDARLALNRHREAARLTGPPAALATILVALAEIELDLSRMEEARRLLQAPELVSEDLSTRLALRVALAQTRLSLLLGRADEARQRCDEALVAIGTTERVPYAPLLMACRGVADAVLHRGDRGDADTREAELELRATAFRPSHAIVSGLRAQARGDAENPTETFRPVADWLEGTQARPLQLAWRLARAGWSVRQGQPAQAAAELAVASALLQELELLQEPNEREAIRRLPARATLLRLQAQVENPGQDLGLHDERP